MNHQKVKLWTKDFLSISFTSFFIFLTFYILLITLPMYILEDLQGSQTEIGLVVSIFLISAILIRPFTGKWVDTVGQKKILLISLILFLVSSLFYFWTTNLWLLLLLRFVHGVGFGMVTTATGAIVADIVPDARRGEGMGYFATFMNLAMVIGPFLGLTTVQHANFTVVFSICVLFSVLSFLCGLLVKIPSKPSVELANTGLHFSNLFEKKAIPIALTAGAISFAYSGILSFLSVYAQEIHLVKAATFFFVVFAIVVILSRPFTGKWFDLHGDNIIIYPSILSLAIGLFLLSQATTSTVLLISGGFIGLGIGTLVPCFQTIAIKAAKPHRRGVATATFFTLFDLGLGVGSSILGFITGFIGYRYLYLSLSIYVLLTILLYFFLHGKNQKTIQIRRNIEAKG
ncbi:MFS family permease [Oikeobacillus pervagus]|uniref:MFS family permease n=1 Tax=Oikeobacillus pervagus TaxID=1325931 RepID=A0AAJ1T3W4_9BACI|nr:MFS transporter [Oikeobacillus pervagus]MDQ0216777.1 MFS family permease [Oikeobacillus pervagus]